MKNNTVTGLRLFWISSVLSMPRSIKKMVQAIFDLIALSVSFYFSIRLVLGAEFNGVEFTAGLVFVLTSVLMFIYMKIYRVIVRFSGVRLLRSVINSLLLSIFALAFVSEFFGYNLELTFFIFLFLTSVFVVGGGRLLMRSIVNFTDYNGLRVIIYGVGKTAVQAMASIHREPGYQLVAFVDGGNGLSGGQLHGIPVINKSRLEAVVTDENVSIVVVSAEEHSKPNVRSLLSRLEALPVSVKSIPSIPDFLNENSISFNQLEEVRIEDLVGRDSVLPDEALMAKNTYGKVVLISGAGGSIGSELARQVITRSPKKLILFELNEFALYRIQQDLLSHSDLITCVLGSVCDVSLLEGLLLNERVDTVFHAAAYKHVPLVESNPFSGIYNNVFGTQSILEASIRVGVKSFTLISTDKAVRPTNIMGASKRIAEILCQNAASQENGTTICMVRFGNVIGSSGSAIPKFREQINAGGPVTVTHPEMTRYFMGIPEAAQLVLQSSSVACGGEVFVLDMGESVRIVDLVKRLIMFSGKTVATEGNRHLNPIEIVYTGLRPGEKLYEELLISGDVGSSIHPKIMVLAEHFPQVDDIDRFIKELRVVCESRSIEALRSLLSEFDIGYRHNDISSATILENAVGKKESRAEVLLGVKDGELSLSKKKPKVSQVGTNKNKRLEEPTVVAKNSLRKKFFLKLLHKYFLLSRGVTMGVRCVMFNSEGQVMLVKHTYVDGWYLPGGGIDLGETASDAVIREVMEEVCLVIDELPQLVGVYFCNQITKRDHVVLFVTSKFSVKKSRAPSFEIDEFKFFSIDNLPSGIDDQTKQWLADAILKQEKEL